MVSKILNIKLCVRIGDKDNEKLINSYEINNITNKFTINNKTYYVLIYYLTIIRL